MAEYARKPKRRFCVFCKDHVEYVDYKDVQMLRKFMTDRGKIKPRRVSGNCAQHQHQVAMAVKRAREMALVPYTVPVISSKTEGRGRRG
jgi:small subunit ribosomal protein S18